MELELTLISRLAFCYLNRHTSWHRMSSLQVAIDTATQQVVTQPSNWNDQQDTGATKSLSSPPGTSVNQDTLRWRNGSTVVVLIVFIIAAEAIFLGWWYGPGILKAIRQRKKIERT